jgi:hypothetical protein
MVKRMPTCSAKFSDWEGVGQSVARDISKGVAGEFNATRHGNKNVQFLIISASVEVEYLKNVAHEFKHYYFFILFFLLFHIFHQHFPHTTILTRRTPNR